MGFKYSYTASDLATAVRVINSVKFDACDSKNDGFISWGAKQDLWRLKWILEDAMRCCPHFSSVEDEWLKEQGKKQVIRILKDEM